MRFVIGLVLAAAIAATAAPVALSGDNHVTFSDFISARPPTLPADTPALCALTVAKSGASTIVCRGTTATPPAKTTTLTGVTCGPGGTGGTGTLIVRASGDVMFECYVPAP